MRGRLSRHVLGGATFLAVGLYVVGSGGCAVPGPVIVVTEAGTIATGARAHVAAQASDTAGIPVGSQDVTETDRSPSQVDALEAQHGAVARRVSALQQGVTRVRGRQLVTNAIRQAVVNRVGSLESRLASLEVEFARRAERLDTILGDLRDEVPAGLDADAPPSDDPAL